MTEARAARICLVFAAVFFLAAAAKVSAQEPAQGQPGREAPPGQAGQEEVWRSAPNPYVRLGDPQTGALLLKTARAGEYIEAPRVAMDANLDVAGPIVRARITQRFANPSDQWVEGVYVFPLPTDAGVDELKIQIGDRFIEGQVKERAEARRIYETARSEGRRAGLVEQERPNMFTTSVANIGPGETVVVQIEYQDTARLSDGTWSVRLPLVVGPRYSPAPRPYLTAAAEERAVGFADPVPDRARISPAVMHPEDEPAQENGALRLPVNIAVSLRPGFALDRVAAPYHPIATDFERDRSAARITLAEGAIPADRDFVLEWRAAGRGAAASLFTETVDGKTYVLGVVSPPAAAPTNKREQPIRETIFVIDNSGSMAGPSMVQAKQALLRALEGLTPDDWFNIIRFDDTMEMMAPVAVTADPREVAYARAFVGRLEADGGTEMLPALRAALTDHHPDPLRVRQVVFLTDGAIGNEDELFEAIETDLGRSRLFTVGIGSAPNTYFMSRAARLGRGTFLHIGDAAEVADKAAALFRTLEEPVLTDLDLVAANDALAETWPAPLPDLYAGEPVVFTARVMDPEARIAVSAQAGETLWTADLDLSHARPARGLARLWARDKIAAIEERRFAPDADYAAIDKAVLDTALAHHLVSRRTSLVAVDVTPARPADAPLAHGAVPTMLPAGWDFGKVFDVPDPDPGQWADAGAQFASLAASAPPGAEAEAADEPGLPLPQGAALVPARIGFGLALLLAGGLVMLAMRRPGRNPSSLRRAVR